VPGLSIEASLRIGLGQLKSRLPFLRAAPTVWNLDGCADVPASPGIWAVEPHIGKGPVGAKWEELLVVTDKTAFWLDEDVPHVRRWRTMNASLS
jgi:hypothetical protein